MRDAHYCRNNKTGACRFGAPWKLSKVPIIAPHPRRKTTLHWIPQRTHSQLNSMLQRYSLTEQRVVHVALEATQSNGDASFTCSNRACAKYTVKYVSKGKKQAEKNCRYLGTKLLYKKKTFV